MNICEENWKTSDNITIYQKSWIPDPHLKAIIVLIHGVGEHISRYEHLARYFCSQRYLVTGIDLRGHGNSGGRRGDTPSYERLLDDIHQFVEKIMGKYVRIPIFIYGHSMGANLVINYLIRDKPSIRGAVFSSPGLKPRSIGPKWKLPVARFLNLLLPRISLSNEVDVDGLSRDKRVVENYKNDPLVHNRITLRMGLSVIDAGKYAVKQAKEISVPSLLLLGTDDRIVDLEVNREFSANLISQHETIEYSKLYHELHNEPESAVVLKDIQQWMEKTIAQGNTN